MSEGKLFHIAIVLGKNEMKKELVLAMVEVD